MKYEGPSIHIELSCYSCTHEESESYRCQSDSGSTVYCTHIGHGEAGKERRYIGDTTWRTPDWCPLKAATLAAFLAAFSSDCAHQPSTHQCMASGSEVPK